ncbi:MAG: DUF3343 domain-containing protein [Cellulosilyticaceae bacterium]
MREKTLQCVVTFKTTTQAMAFEEAAKAAGFGGRLIPLPRAIGAGCGLAWRDVPQEDPILALIQSRQLGYEQIYEIVI